MTRLVDERFMDMRATKSDAVDAAEIAHGFGVLDSDITFIEDMPLSEINAIFAKLESELKQFTMTKKQTFLFVYVAGHGIIVDSV